MINLNVVDGMNNRLELKEELLTSIRKNLALFFVLSASKSPNVHSTYVLEKLRKIESSLTPENYISTFTSNMEKFSTFDFFKITWTMINNILESKK